MLGPLDQLDAGQLQQICAQQWQESQTLDFKSQLPTPDSRGRQEFMKDVCAMANAEGGDLVYGVSESNGAADCVVPIVSTNVDAEMRRLNQLFAGIEPRVQGVRFKRVDVGNGFVLVVRVPFSFDGPHRFSVNNASRFVMRNGTHTSDLTYDQLRSASDRSATLSERARRFRIDRLSMIERRDTARLGAHVASGSVE